MAEAGAEERVEPTTEGALPWWRRPATLLAFILLIGLALRLIWPFDHLGPLDDRPEFGTLPGDVPFGFHTDEGHNALDAWRIASEGWRPIFLERNNGREPLFMYLMAACMALLGPTIPAARLAGTLAGLATIAAQLLLVRSLPLRRPARVALLSAAFLAFAFWPVAQARYALRANLLPLWVTLMLWAWWRAIGGSTRGAWAALAGLFIGLAVHTHLTGRVLPAVLVASALWVLVRERRPRVLLQLAIALLVALMVAWPQIAFFRAHPEMLTYRADQVSVLNPEVNEGDLLGTLLENGWSLMAMPVLEGDGSWYHNLEGQAVFVDPLSRLAFLIGLVVAAAWLLGRAGRPAQSAAVLLLATLGVTLAPSWLSVGAPNYVRLTGIWPVLFLIPALGLDRAAAWIEGRRLPVGLNGRRAARLLLVATPALLLLVTSRDYFGRYAGRPEVYDAFNAAAVERGQALARLSGPTYVSPALWRQSVIRFTTMGSPPAGSFDPRAGIVFPRKVELEGQDGLTVELRALANYAFDPVELDAAEDFGQRWPMAERRQHGGRTEGPLADAVNLVTFTLQGSQIEEILEGMPAVPPVQFGTNIRMDRARVVTERPAAGAPLEIELVWEALSPTELDHNFFLRLTSQVDGSTVAQFDGPPLEQSYPTNAWQPGERILMPLRLEVAPDAPAGPAILSHGWYDWRDGRRLPIAGDEDAAADIAQLEVTAP